MKWLRLFEDFNNEWYDQISDEQYQFYLNGESDYGQPTSFTSEEVGRIKVPKGFDFRLETNGPLSNNPKGQFMSIIKYRTDYSSSRVSRMFGMKTIEHLFNITKYQDDWFVVKYLTINGVQYYRCDSYLGVNQLISDLVD